MKKIKLWIFCTRESRHYLKLLKTGRYFSEGDYIEIAKLLYNRQKVRKGIFKK